MVHGCHSKLVLTIVVNGTPTEVETNPEAQLQTVIPVALKQTGNEGQPLENWELKVTTFKYWPVCNVCKRQRQ